MGSGDERQGILGAEISEDAALQCLDRAEYGVLCLTKEGETYPVPISFGYDPAVTTLYFLMAFEQESKKRRFIESTETASFAVVESELPDRWTSVIITGTLAPLVDDERTAFAALSETASFPAIYTFEEYYEMESTDQEFYQLDVETISARSADRG